MELKDATVLIVDDEVALLDIFKDWLQRQGCRVLTAENGQEGLEAATREHVDAIISDVRMPVMNGIEMARRLSAAGAYHAKVVFVSGFTDVAERDCYDLGVHVALNKPMRRAQLIAAVKRCLMEREDVWSVPPTSAPEDTITAALETMAEAQLRGLIAFGRGGFCLHSSFPARDNAAIGLDLSFAGDLHALRGAGEVRWIEHTEAQLGIEITYIDEANRAWVAALARDSGSTAFIPRSSGGKKE